ELSESQKQTISSLATIAAGIAGGLAGDGTAAALAGAQSGKGVVENNSLSAVIQGGELAAHGCMKISACRDRLVGSGLGALLGVGASTSAMDALSNDEQMNLIYVASLNDPSLLSQLNDAQKAAYESLTGKTITSTDGTQVINPGPSNTGGDQTVTGNVPSNTGNNQPSGQGVTNTGNTDGNPDTGGNTTVTPIPEGPSKDGLAYLSGDNKYVPSPKHGAGGWGTPMDLSDSKAQEVLNNSIQGGKQRYGVADGKVYEFQPDNVGGWHGYPIPGNEAPPKVLRELLYRGDISKVEYNKMIKGKL
ncbi:MAG: VENN motif pre-toxin domain-containing protein, partial [Leclercia adecarboxylata]|nr:VENN motif pre-toxin domain-containing protein [Leclercia adecarboxylata]